MRQLVSKRTVNSTGEVLTEVRPWNKSKGDQTMPLYMDVHNIEGGVSSADVAKAHEADLATQSKHGVNYKSYWVDEKAGKIFCLVDAPNAETANTVHREAHGLVADQIFEVSEH